MEAQQPQDVLSLVISAIWDFRAGDEDGDACDEGDGPDGHDDGDDDVNVAVAL